MPPVRNIVPGQSAKFSFTPFELRVLAGILDVPPNNAYWVDSADANAGDQPNRGTRDQPFSTINWAMSNANSPLTASRGDVLLVGPRHVETITVAGGTALTRAGASVVGLAYGDLRPTITLTTATTATLLVNGANILLTNFNITLNGIDALAGPLAVQAAGFRFLNNRVLCADVTNQATLAMLTTAAADRLTVKGNVFTGSADAGMTAAIRLVGGAEIEIEDNLFIGAYGSGNGAIENITTAVAWLTIHRNRINNLTAANTKAITAVAGTTGIISENKMQILAGVAPITAAGMSWVGQNYYANAVATAGTLI